MFRGPQKAENLKRMRNLQADEGAGFGSAAEEGRGAKKVKKAVEGHPAVITQNRGETGKKSRKPRCSLITKPVPVLERIRNNRVFDKPEHTNLKIPDELPGNGTKSVKDIMCLQNDIMLTDEVVNLYLSMLENDCSNSNKTKLLVMNSFWFSKLTHSNKKNTYDKKVLQDYKYANVKRWSKPSKIRAATNGQCETVFDLDYMIFPVHIEDRQHWMLGVVDFTGNKIMCYNSDDASEFDMEKAYVQAVAQRFLEDEWNDKIVSKHRPMEGFKKAEGEEKSEGAPGQTKKAPPQIPDFEMWEPIVSPAQQTNCVECGVFILAYAYAVVHFSSQPTSKWPTQKEMMGNSRDRVLHDILNTAGLTNETKKLPSMYNMFNSFG